MNTALSPEARTPYQLRFTEMSHEEGPGWLGAARQAAFDAFLAQGWPSLKQEDWRFTDVTPITEMELLPAPVTPRTVDPLLFDARCFGLGGEASHRLVFADGRHHSTRQLGGDAHAGLRLLRLSSAEASEDPELSANLGSHLHNRNAFVALNTVFVSDGAFIKIPAGLRCEMPIYLVHLASATGCASFPRSLVVAGANSQATVVEVYLGAEGQATLSNSATEIVLGADAQLTYHSIQKSAAEGFHIGHVAVTQDSGSVFSGHTLALDGRLIRRDVQIMLAGESCTCQVDGIYLVSGQSHVDNQTTIDHSKPRSTSREDYRGVIAEAGHAVFAGRIFVRAGAAKTDAQQSNRNLLLSDTARVDSKPQLEILTSDVKCSHGATTGRLDPDALFYLRARGIDARAANRILTRAFLQQGVERVASPDIRAELEGLLDIRIADLMSEGGGP